MISLRLMMSVVGGQTYWLSVGQGNICVGACLFNKKACEYFGNVGLYTRSRHLEPVASCAIRSF
jgi:hypothetical protein